MFLETELKRYSRQMAMEGWGEETQAVLKKSTVFIAGAGGLGSPVSLYLAAAGVGTLKICDFDTPDFSNLNRQILHTEERIGMNKAMSAQKTIASLNPYISVIAIPDAISEDTVWDFVGSSDIIVDCMDNYPARYLLNRTAFRKRIPFVHGSIWGMEGRMTFLSPPETPCLECMFPEAPKQEVFPVVGVTPGVIGTLQALEVLKYLTGIGQNLRGKLLVWDGARNDFRSLPAYRNPQCSVCAG